MTGARALVTGWFSFELRGATAGDLLIRDLVCTWLEEAGIPHDVAHAPPFRGGVDWRDVDPRSYTTVVFACGPFYAGRRAASVLGPAPATALARLERRVGRRARNPLSDRVVDLLHARFAHARWLGVNLSMLGPTGTWHPFDHLFARDHGPGTARPDLVLAAPATRVPVVGIALVDAQGEYRGGAQDRAAAALEALLAAREVARVAVDTRLDIPNRAGLRTPAEVESLIARLDVLVTTRLHGLVMAIKHGVPVVAVDPIPGGAKVTAQAEALGWPCVTAVEDLSAPALDEQLDWCLTEEARACARGRRDAARHAGDAVHAGFLAAVREGRS